MCTCSVNFSNVSKSMSWDHWLSSFVYVPQNNWGLICTAVFLGRRAPRRTCSRRRLTPRRRRRRRCRHVAAALELGCIAICLANERLIYGFYELQSLLWRRERYSVEARCSAGESSPPSSGSRMTNTDYWHVTLICIIKNTPSKMHFMSTSHKPTS